jgi:hypothetical protein
MCFGCGGGDDEDVQGRQCGGGVVKYVVHFSSVLPEWSPVLTTKRTQPGGMEMSHAGIDRNREDKEDGKAYSLSLIELFGTYEHRRLLAELSPKQQKVIRAFRS